MAAFDPHHMCSKTGEVHPEASCGCECVPCQLASVMVGRSAAWEAAAKPFPNDDIGTYIEDVRTRYRLTQAIHTPAAAAIHDQQIAAARAQARENGATRDGGPFTATHLEGMLFATGSIRAAWAILHEVGVNDHAMWVWLDVFVMTQETIFLAIVEGTTA